MSLMRMVGAFYLHDSCNKRQPLLVHGKYYRVIQITSRVNWSKMQCNNVSST